MHGCIEMFITFFGIIKSVKQYSDFALSIDQVSDIL